MMGVCRNCGHGEEDHEAGMYACSAVIGLEDADECTCTEYAPADDDSEYDDTEMTITAAGRSVSTTGKALRETLEGIQYMPPSVEAFVEAEFLASPALTDLANELVERHPRLTFIRDYDFVVMWKAEGGAKAGKAVLGKCVKASGLAAFFSGQDWVIWLAADHARAAKLTARQVEAVVFHELNHCALKGDPPRPGIRGHDIEEFMSVVEEYGLWDATLQTAAETMARQLPLWERPGGGSSGAEVAPE